MTVPKADFHIASLDGLRALSIALVFFAHSGMSLGLDIPGGFGVTVFFFLSGYLITTLLRREYERTGGVSFSKFYLRRALRILPTFYIVLMLALASAFFLLDMPGEINPDGVLAQMLHYTNYWIIGHSFDGLAGGTGVYWSLAVEEHFYLLFPLVFLYLMRSGARPERQAMVLLGACVLLLIWRIYLAGRLEVLGVESRDRLELASDTRFDSLLYGCILALYGNPALDKSRFGERLWKYVFLPLGIGGLLFSFLYRDQGFRDTFRYTLQGVSLIPVFVCAVRYPDWAIMRPLNFRPVAFLGVLSYSLYLVHQVVLVAVWDQFPDLGITAQGLLSLAISIGISWLLYVCVEKPCARLRHRLQAGARLGNRVAA